MTKRIVILNGMGAVGKGEFASFVSQYIPTYKYSIIDLPKKAATLLGWDGGKTEKDRKFLSDIMDLSTEYNDSPWRDVVSVVTDFLTEKNTAKVLMVDMRDPKDIKRAKETFGATTVLIRNPNAKTIVGNHADVEVENYKYDYIIENDGTLGQLETMAKIFVRDILLDNEFPVSDEPFVLTCSKY